MHITVKNSGQRQNKKILHFFILLCLKFSSLSLGSASCLTILLFIFFVLVLSHFCLDFFYLLVKPHLSRWHTKPKSHDLTSGILLWYVDYLKTMKALRNCILIYFRLAGYLFIIFFHVIYCEKYRDPVYPIYVKYRIEVHHAYATPLRSGCIMVAVVSSSGSCSQCTRDFLFHDLNYFQWWIKPNVDKLSSWVCQNRSGPPWTLLFLQLNYICSR